MITGVALILSNIKIARLLYELAIHQVATQVIALLDVMTAQRLRKCIQMLLATFATLIGIFFLLQMYLIGMEYIQNVTPIPLKLILMIALAWSVVDGPNLFEQLFGVDAGLHGAMQSIYGLKAAGGAMVGGAALLGGRGLIEKVKAGGVLGSALKVGGTLGGGAAGGAAGLAAGRFDVHRRVQAVRAAAEKRRIHQQRQALPRKLLPEALRVPELPKPSKMLALRRLVQRLSQARSNQLPVVVDRKRQQPGLQTQLKKKSILLYGKR